MAVSARGGAARQLTTGPFDAMPSFSPDGRRIAFTRVVQSVVAPTASLFTVDGAGRHLEPLLADGIDLSAAWSPDGKTIAFSRLESTSRPLREATLYLADADGSHLRSLGLHGLSAAWSPDGTRLAFVSFDDANAPPCPAASCPPSGELYVVRRRRQRAAAADEQQGRRRASELVARRLADRLRERLRRAQPGPRAVADGDPCRRRQGAADRPHERRDRPVLEPRGRSLGWPHEARRHPSHHGDHRRRAAQRRLLRPRAGPAPRQEVGQPGRPDRLPPLLRRRARLRRARPHVLRVPGRRAGPGRRRAWSTASSGASAPPDALDFWAERLWPARASTTEREGDNLLFADPEGLEHELLRRPTCRTSR